MIEIEITTVEEFLQVIKQQKERAAGQANFHDLVFRGQPADYPLIPKFCRLQPAGSHRDTERLLLYEFKRANPLLIEPHRPMDDWDYLTLGQHFGLPTRMLDWSDNALTALWFATASPIRDEECNVELPAPGTYAVVWILIAMEDDVNIDIEAVHPFEVTDIRIVRPRIIKQRINNQSGVFTVWSTDAVQQRIPLNEAEAFRDRLVRVKIPAACKGGIRTDLDTLGVNAFSIFPELEGLCRHLQWKHFAI